MKKHFITIILLLMFSTMAFASVYVVYDKATNDVYFLTDDEKKIILNDNDYGILKLEGELSSYPLEYPIHYYQLKDNKLVVNTKKISDEENAKTSAEGKMQEWEAIKLRAYKNVYQELINEGVKFKYITLQDFGEE